MTSNNELLEAIEKEIREQVGLVKNARSLLWESEKYLHEIVEKYRAERERLQREIWAREKIGWCHRCEKFYPQESIGLLYTQGNEWHGSEYSENYNLYKRLRTFCKNCIEVLLSSPRGGKEEFQCFNAESQDGKFLIFMNGEWRPLLDSNNTKIQIERGYIPEEEYQFGKQIWYGSNLKIGKEEML